MLMRKTTTNLKSNRSRVTNGSTLLPGTVDHRLAWPRRLRDVLDEHIADLGGPEACSAAERSIVRRAATLTVECERMESLFATAGEASAEAIDLYSRLAGNLRRLLESVGIARRSRDVTPSLVEYLAAPKAIE
jgi:hypothetical protein